MVCLENFYVFRKKFCTLCLGRDAVFGSMSFSVGNFHEKNKPLINTDETRIKLVKITDGTIGVSIKGEIF